MALEHQSALAAQRSNAAELKDQLVQARLQHERALKEAKAAGDGKVEEARKEFAEATAQLREELEEETGLLQHLSRLKRAITKFDTAWHDASGNVVVSSILLSSKLYSSHICRFSISQIICISSQSPSFGLRTQFLARNFLGNKKPA